MTIRFRAIVQSACFGLIVAAGLPHAVLADEGNRAPRAPLLPAYQQECASCHIAYPPGMLPAASWQRMLNNLQRHFGADASTDAATVRALSAWLSANAGTYKRVHEEPPDNRITQSAWFLRKHNKVPAATWKLRAVKSAANCTACHTQADKGDFNERNIRVPR